MRLVLVDTSCWVHALRKSGDAEVRARIADLVHSGLACWCAPVRLELWNGAGDLQERKILREFEARLPDLPITDAVWTLAFDLARKLRAGGLSLPATDILIAACARHHGAGIESSDSDFERIAGV